MRFAILLLLVMVASVASAQDKPLVRLEGSPERNSAIKIFLPKTLTPTDTVTYSFKGGHEYWEPPFVSVLEFPSDTVSKNIMHLKLQSGHELKTEIKIGYKYLYIELEKGRWFLNYSNTPRDEMDKLPEGLK